MPKNRHILRIESFPESTRELPQMARIEFLTMTEMKADEKVLS